MYCFSCSYIENCIRGLGECFTCSGHSKTLFNDRHKALFHENPGKVAPAKIIRNTTQLVTVDVHQPDTLKDEDADHYMDLRTWGVMCIKELPTCYCQYSSSFQLFFFISGLVMYIYSNVWLFSRHFKTITLPACYYKYFVLSLACFRNLVHLQHF